MERQGQDCATLPLTGADWALQLTLGPEGLAGKQEEGQPPEPGDGTRHPETPAPPPPTHTHTNTPVSPEPAPVYIGGGSRRSVACDVCVRAGVCVCLQIKMTEKPIG